MACKSSHKYEPNSKRTNTYDPLQFVTDAKYGRWHLPICAPNLPMTNSYLWQQTYLWQTLTYDKLKVVEVLNSIAQEFQVIVQVLDFAQLLFHHILCNTHTHI